MLLLSLFIVSCLASLGPFPARLPRRLRTSQNNLPQLYKIQTIHLTGPYGCIPGYNGSAIFLSEADRARNAPILLYDGNCPPQSTDFLCAMAGNDVASIADLGAVKLTSFSANDAIFAKNFQDEPPVVEGHSYFAIIARDDLRAMLAWSVDKLYPNGAADLSYAVMMYEEHTVTQESQGWDWSSHNQ